MHEHFHYKNLTHKEIPGLCTKSVDNSVDEVRMNALTPCQIILLHSLINFSAIKQLNKINKLNIPMIVSREKSERNGVDAGFVNFLRVSR